MLRGAALFSVPQSLIFGWIYGFGLGLFGRLGAAATLTTEIVIYAGQAMFQCVVAALWSPSNGHGGR